ncbi:MAG: hypothetical protein LBG88_01070 [Christensenellaceae bacterium]|jgi:hypothetical protein|nr:hypothetical protein [Christensenellaceae bacterium]
MPNLDNVMGGVSLGLIGALLVFIAWGVLWGTLRGAKRQGIRLATVVVALGLALLMTPMFSGALVNGRFFGGKTAGDMVADAIFKGDLGQAIGENADAAGMITFAMAYATALLNLIMFIVLGILFNLLSLIPYSILASRFAPKAKRGGSAKRYRLAGLGIGAVTGIVFFGFFFTPITGTLAVLDKGLGYHPSFTAAAEYSRMSDTEKQVRRTAETENTSLYELYDGMNDLNNAVNHSAFAQITKYTGIQGFGRGCFGYLTTVKGAGKKVNVASDLEKICQTAKDGVAIMIEMNRIEVDTSETEGELGIIQKLPKLMEQFSDADYAALRNMVDRIFKIKTVQVVFGYANGLIDALETAHTLDSMFDGISDAPTFRHDAYTALKAITDCNKLSADIKSLLHQDKRLITTITTLKGVMNSGNAEQAIFDIDKDDDDNKQLHAIANVLGTLTNGESLAPLIRLVLSTMIEKVDIPASDFIDMRGTVDTIKVKLSPIPDPLPTGKTRADYEIDWFPMLKSLHQMACFALGFDASNLTVDDLRDLLNTVIGSDILAPIIVDLLTSTMAETGVALNIDPSVASDFLTILAGTEENPGIVDTFIDLFNGDGEGLNASDPDELLAIFGGDSGILMQLADLNEGHAEPVVVIDIGSMFGEDATGQDGYESALGTAIEEMFGTNASKIKLLFGL